MSAGLIHTLALYPESLRLYDWYVFQWPRSWTFLVRSLAGPLPDRKIVTRQEACMPTFPDYPEVSQIWHWSPTPQYTSPNLPDKMDFRTFLHYSLKFSPFFSQNSNFLYSLYSFWDIFAHIYSLRKITLSFIQWWKQILIACKTS